MLGASQIQCSSDALLDLTRSKQRTVAASRRMRLIQETRSGTGASGSVLVSELDALQPETYELLLFQHVLRVQLLNELWADGLASTGILCSFANLHDEVA